MFFILSKVFYFLLIPYTWLLIVLLLLWRAKTQKWAKRYKFTFVFILIFFSNSAVHKFFVSFWEVPATKIENVANYDVGIVLGGMSEYNNDVDRISIRRGGDRIWQAISLYKNGNIKKILISGASGYVSDRGLEEASQMKKVLISWGIPEEDLIEENTSRNTFENAKFSVEILKRDYPELKTKLLITSGRHMKRAEACFEKQEIEVDCFSTDMFTGPNVSYNWDEFIVPNPDNFNYWTGLIKEWVGYIVYALTDKI